MDASVTVTVSGMHADDVALAGMDGQAVRQFNRANQLLQTGRVQDQQEAAALFREVAERSGAAVPQHNMATLYDTGIGVPKIGRCRLTVSISIPELKARLVSALETNM
jgi:hypothetical protein